MLDDLYRLLSLSCSINHSILSYHISNCLCLFLSESWKIKIADLAPRFHLLADCLTKCVKVTSYGDTTNTPPDEQVFSLGKSCDNRFKPHYLSALLSGTRCNLVHLLSFFLPRISLSRINISDEFIYIILYLFLSGEQISSPTHHETTFDPLHATQTDPHEKRSDTQTSSSRISPSPSSPTQSRSQSQSRLRLDIPVAKGFCCLNQQTFLSIIIATLSRDDRYRPILTSKMTLAMVEVLMLGEHYTSVPPSIYRHIDIADLQVKGNIGKGGQSIFLYFFSKLILYLTHSCCEYFSSEIGWSNSRTETF